MKKRNKFVLQFLMAFCLFPILVVGQTGKKDHLNKWGIGVGYNFLHRSKLPFNERTFEISVKYLYTDKHSFYLTVPFYFENNKDEQKDFKIVLFNDPWLKRIWGINIGYTYNFFQWNGISGFGGVGFDFKRDKDQVIYYYYLDDAYGNPSESHSIGGSLFTGYGLSPQIGLSYRFKNIGCELKYKFSGFRVRMTPISKDEDGHDILNKEQMANSIEHYFKFSQDLSLSLYYYF